jgi:cytochrome c oxidase assembly factor CtaG
MTGKELLFTLWAPGLVVPLFSVAALAAYVARFRGRLSLRAGYFGLAVALFFLALASPIGVLARGYLFSAHMLQHLLLTLAIPPLVLLSLPTPSSSDAPERDRTGILVSWLAGVGAMWIWHARPLCNAAAASTRVQVVQTVSLLVMGLAFWRPVLSPRARDRIDPLPAVVYLFGGCIACTILGILVTLSPIEVCSAYMNPTDTLGVLPLLRDSWGLSCKADQQLGGLLMWVPACFVYAAAILGTLGTYYSAEGRRPAHARGSE